MVSQEISIQEDSKIHGLDPTLILDGAKPSSAAARLVPGTLLPPTADFPWATSFRCSTVSTNKEFPNLRVGIPKGVHYLAHEYEAMACVLVVPGGRSDLFRLRLADA